MIPSTLYEKPDRPTRWWIAVTILTGIIGSVAAIGIGGKGTYDVGPFETELRARPAVLGKTELAVHPLPGVQPGHAEAGTHRAPIQFRATITGVRRGADLVRSDLRTFESPYSVAELLAAEGKDAARAFGIKLAALAAGGSLAGGLLISMGRWRRTVGAFAAGILTFAVLGLLIQQTYDKEEFRRTQFVPEPGSTPPPLLPTP